MKKRWGTRLVSLILCVAMSVTMLPASIYANEIDTQTGMTQNTASQQEDLSFDATESAMKGASLGEAAAQAETQTNLQYELNGGAFVEGYQAPESYPTSKLPDWTEVEKPGYAFAGWYDNEAMNGEAVTGISGSAYSGNVVLYAKWTDRYYFVDIPASVTADDAELIISGTADGLYTDECVNVSISSENDWKLKDGAKMLSYELRDKDSNVALGNNALVMSLSDIQKSNQKVYVCSVTEEPEYSGQYRDNLTFQVDFESKKYTVSYDARGGLQDDENNPGELIVIEPETVNPGTTLDSLPIPFKSGYTFLGWCYDEECTDYVDSSDRVLNDVVLYASYVENQQYESHTIDTFARAIDVDGANFVIQVTDKSGKLTAEQIKAACTLKNLSDNTENVTLNVTAAGNNTYTISKAAGWKEGSSYKLLLDNSDLYFTGFDSTIREYEIIIHKDEVNNVELNQNIKYINVKELSDLTVNGQSVQSVSIATMTVGMDGQVTSQGSDTTGSFTYTGSRLKLGDQIAVYSGDVIPTMEVTSSADGSDISFFEITSVNGNRYEYRGSKTEDVLFMPEVLPLDVAKDQDGDATNNCVTVNISDLTFGNDELSRQLQLDADTTVDEGDFLAFYTNLSSGTPTYGKITSILSEDGKYIIDYQPVTWEQVQTAMDVYQTEDVEGESLLEQTDTTKLAGNIEEQAVESGFVDDVAQQIAIMTMRTDSYQELQKSLEEELGAQIEISNPNQRSATAGEFAYQKNLRATPGDFTYQDNLLAAQNELIYQENLLAAGANPRVELGMPQVRANLGTKLKHFDGDVSGVHLALEISVPITIHVARWADFEITVTATFEQEIRVAINVDGEAIWKVWGIFPYIADYRVTASLELYEYTGMGIDINFKTVEGDNPWLSAGSGGGSTSFKKKQKLANDVAGIVGELEDMMEDGREYISDKSPLMVSLGDSDAGGLMDEISVAKSLAERYADLLEDEADWVRIYERNIVDQHIRVILVIDIGFQVNFVVSANVNVSIGMTFWYKNAKRFVFSLHVKERKATSDTIDLCDEEYEFTAYAMGTIGIKAGVELYVRVGLLSTELASVGLSAEVGGYVQLWGYLYYQLKYSSSEGRNTRAMGALYLEIGIYLEIKFRAQALSSAFTYAPTLYEAMWPLYTVGTLENVLDFTDDTNLEYNLKREVRNIILPDDVFSMNYMDMKEGLDDGEYFTKIYEDDSDKYFSISITNDAFTYDPETNIITVNPGDEKTVDGEMIITWKNQPGTFNTKPFQKKIKLHWDCLRDGYFIAFVSNGGNYVNPINQKYGTAVTAPPNPTKTGYVFAGWYEDEELTIPYTIPSEMPDKDALVFAKWEPAKVRYTVKNYVEESDGVYEIPEGGIVQGKALTGSQISPVPAVREGYKTPAQRTVTVEADGSTVIEYYYARDNFQATFKSDDEIVSTGSYAYNTMMPVPAVYKPGYEFKGWILQGEAEVSEVPVLVPAKDVTYFAKWEPLSDIAYAVKYYVQNENGNGYTLDQIQYLTGSTGATVTAPAGVYASTGKYHLKDYTSLPSGVIAADGSLELKVYYDLNTYTITYDKVADDATIPTDVSYTTEARPGQKVVTPIPNREGYTFEGWYKDSAYNTAFDNTMTYQALTLYAKWEQIQVNYVVRHYQEDAAVLGEVAVAYSNEDSAPTTGSQTYTLVDEEVFKAPIGKEVTPNVKQYNGFISPSVQTQTVTVDNDGKGTLVIDYYYDRKEYMIEWYNDVSDYPCLIDSDYVQYGADVGQPKEELSKTGYRLVNWYTEPELTNVFTDKKMPDHDLALYPKWEPVEIEYKVKYMYETDQHSFVEFAEDSFVALADSEIAFPEAKTFEGYTYFGRNVGTDKYKVDPQGELCIEYRYNVNTHTLTYRYDTASGESVETSPTKYGEIITNYVPTRDGYAFAGWYTDPAYTELYTGTMPDKDLTLYGKWELGKKSYMVLHYLKALRDGDSAALYLIEHLYGDLNAVVSPPSKAPEGFQDVTEKSVTLKEGETPQIEYEYERQTYNISYYWYDDSGTERNHNEQLQYGDTITFNPNTSSYASSYSRAGYELAGWYTDRQLETPLTDTTVPAHEMTLYAKWEALKSQYVVEHYRQYSSTEGNYYLYSREYLYADTDSTVTPAVNQYEGYTSPETKSGVVKGNPNDKLTIRYYYACNTHRLTLHDVCRDYNNLTDEVSTQKYGSSLPSQYRWGYTFGGWYEDAEYTIPYTGMMPDRDLTLYAKWTAQECSYQVVHQQQDVSGWYQTVEIENGKAETGSFITPNVRQYEGFVTPTVNPLEISALNSNYFTIRYARKQHTATFVLDNGEANIVKRGYYGSNVTAPKPKKEGYTFVGWDEDVVETMPDQDVVYTAQWRVNTYRLSYVVDGVTDTEGKYQSKLLSYGQTITLPEDPVRVGYQFAGWGTSVPKTMPASSVTLIAQWKPIQYSITYNLAGGRFDKSNPSSYTYDSDTINLNPPTREYYTFTGWSGTGITGTSSSVAIKPHSTGNRTYTANWKPVEYNIEFRPIPGCTVKAMPPQTGTINEPVTLNTCAYTYTGCTFRGWSTKQQSSPSIIYTINYRENATIPRLSGNLVLYPVFEPNLYRVRFAYNNHVKQRTLNYYYYGTTVTFPSDATNPGYHLLGWEKDSGGSILLPENKYVLYDTQTVTWTAQWKANDTFSYRPSKSSNKYTIHDDKDGETTFTFYVDGQQTKNKVTGDYGLGGGADYVMNMDNISYTGVHDAYKKITINVSYDIEVIKEGYSVLRITYKTADGKEHVAKENSVGLKTDPLDPSIPAVIECPDGIDVTSIKLEFDANGKGHDEYILSDLNIDIKFSEK